MIQLRFTCPECRLSGLTPEIEESRAIAVALKQLHIRCPACSAIVEVAEPLGSLLCKMRESVAGLVVQQAELTSFFFRQALEAEAARQAAEKEKEHSEGQQAAPPNGGPVAPVDSSSGVNGPPSVS